MKPIVGITVNATDEASIARGQRLALSDQTVQYVADDYVRAIEQAGAVPILIPIMTNVDNMSPLLSILDGIVFTGGSDIDPEYYDEVPKPQLGEVRTHRDAHEVALMKKVIAETTIPVLGICRGAQLLNVAKGGSLYQDITTQRPTAEEHSYFGRSPKHVPVHTVTIAPDSKLHQFVGQPELHVNSFHHQSLKDIGRDLLVVATAPDGTVEAIEHEGERSIVAVQWHPEMMAEHDGNSANLFHHFVTQCTRA